MLVGFKSELRSVSRRNDGRIHPEYAFCKLRGIHDACAGPHTGDSKEKYVTDSIDKKTKLYKLRGGRAGIVADMLDSSGLRGVV